MGLLDLLQDPHFLLSMGAGLLSHDPRQKANFGNDLSRGLLSGMQGHQQNQAMQMRKAEEEQQRQMRQMQMDQMRRQGEQETAVQALGQRAYAPPQAAPNDPYQAHQAPGGGGDAEFAQGMMGIDPVRGFALRQQLTPKPKMQFAPNGVAVDMNALKPGESFAKQPDWKDPEYESVQSRIRAAGRPQVTTNIMPPREIFKDSMALKKDFDAQPEVKGFKEVQAAWDQISTALSDPSAANDLAAATKFMKLLDPGSVVRESELVMAMQASGALDRFLNLGQRIAKGHKLTPDQRVEFRSAGEALYNASKQRFGETVGQYEGIAKQYGLDAQFLPKPEAKKETKTVKMNGKPVEAKQAPDGHYYIKSGNRYYRVEE